eukprot:3934347-Lingulodinium_polyedra.AAC.1
MLIKSCSATFNDPPLPCLCSDHATRLICQNSRRMLVARARARSVHAMRVICSRAVHALRKTLACSLHDH